MTNPTYATKIEYNTAQAVLLLHMDGADGSSTFTDSSTYGHTVTPHNSARISTAQSVFGGASGLFSKATKDYLSIASSTDFTLSGAFTIEFRAFLNSAITVPNHRFLVGFYDGTNIDYVDCYYTGVGMQFYAFFNTGTVTTTVGSVAINTWYAVAITRDSLGVLRIFLNGALVQSAAAATNRSAATTVIIGEHPSAPTDTTSWDGYIDEIRITNGACLYTKDYTLATAAFATSGSTFTDVSQYALSASIWRSLSDTVTPVSPGRAILKLVNEDGRFNDAFTYTGSNSIPIGRRVQITATYSAIEYDLFTGYIQSIDRDAQYGNRVAVINCYDLSQKLMRANISSQIFTNYAVSSLATWVASLAGVSSLTAIDAISDQVPYYWADNEPASNAIQKLINFGHYYAFTDGAGNFNLKDRNSYVGATAVYSYNAFLGLTTTHDENKILNNVTITGQARQLYTTPSTVAWLSGPLQINAGDTTTFFLQYVDPLVPTDAAPAINMQTPVNSSDYTLNSASDGSGSDLTATATASVTFFGATALCAVYNGGAAGYVTKFQLLGQSIRQMPAIRQTTQDSASQVAYGDKQFNLQSDFIYDPNYAASYSAFLVDKYKDSFPQINLGLVRNLFPDVLDVEVGDVLSVTNSFLGVSSSYVVRDINHTVDLTNGLEHTLQVMLEVARTGPYLILDNPVYGLLDSGRQWGF